MKRILLTLSIVLTISIATENQSQAQIPILADTEVECTEWGHVNYVAVPTSTGTVYRPYQERTCSLYVVLFGVRMHLRDNTERRYL